MNDGTTPTAAPSRSHYTTVAISALPLFFKILRQLGTSLEEFQEMR